jgi:predicted small metal-binding protein
MVVEHRCANVGAFPCKAKLQADNMDDLMRLVADHLQRVHAVKTPTATILNYVAKMAAK